MERNLVVFHKFRPSLKTRYVRIHPRTWYSYISMRVELYGCRLGKMGFSYLFPLTFDKAQLYYRITYLIFFQAVTVTNSAI